MHQICCFKQLLKENYKSFENRNTIRYKIKRNDKPRWTWISAHSDQRTGLSPLEFILLLFSTDEYKFRYASEFKKCEMAIDLSVMPIVISSFTAAIFAITLIITWKSIKENTRDTYSQLLRGFHEDLTNRLDKQTRQTD